MGEEVGRNTEGRIPKFTWIDDVIPCVHAFLTGALGTSYVLTFSFIINPRHANYVFVLVRILILPTLHLLVIARNDLLFSKNALVVLES